MYGEKVLGGIVAFSLLKKVTAYGLARYYGFPRIYRKIIRMNRRVGITGADERRMNDSIKGVFRFPNKALKWWRDRWKGTGEISSI